MIVAGAAPDWRTFDSRDTLAETLAKDVASSLTQAIAERGVAFLAVSGGSTPGGMFRALSNAEIDWSKVVVTLIDERFVPESSPRSNAALVRATLLQNRARAAQFVPLYQPAGSVEEAATQASDILERLPWPLDVALLGMGVDGHTASFFPDAINLDSLLSPHERGYVLPVHALSAEERRLTLPLARIVAAGRVAVQIEGEEKRIVMQAALAPGATRPISAVFREGKKPIEIYWAP